MNAILLSSIAGIIGTGSGGLITALIGSRTDKMIGVILSFAGGVMTSIVFFELIPEAEQHASLFLVILGLCFGIVMVLLLNTLIDRMSNTDHKRLHNTFEEFYHEGEIISHKSTMLQSGILMFFVIGLHNVPEGLVIGVAGNHSASLKLTLAIMIGVHNIPEGMAISAPLLSGGMKRWNAILIAALAGVPTVLGAVVGFLAGTISDTATAISFSVAGGAMLYAVFGEIIPQSMSINKNRVPTISLLIGIVFGQLLTKI
ncbi:MAG: ZIP family metal transporter [Clostridia bacterium]|nr:ZIP family metal transporter [Clostridia bacterium]